MANWIVFAMGLMFAAFAAHGVRTGRAVRGSQTFSRREWPALFWVAVIINAALAITCILGGLGLIAR